MHVNIAKNYFGCDVLTSKYSIIYVNIFCLSVYKVLIIMGYNKTDHCGYVYNFDFETQNNRR